MITLDKERHIYKDAGGSEYISTTTFIDKFVEPFDQKGYIAASVAKKKGITADEVKAEWKGIAKEAALRGRNIHAVLEDYIIDKKVDPNYLDLISNLESIRFTGKLRSEELLYNQEYYLAGTADLIEEFPSGRLNIWDFKTNKTIDYGSKYNKRMLEPISHLEACSYVKYSLQLSIYAWMLEQNGATIGKLGILWIDQDNNIHVIPTVYQKYTVEAMLNYYKENKIQ